MGIEKLKIFVSGKEDELQNERETVRDLIITMGYEPKGSEDRSASGMSIVDKYHKELYESDIYVGIFGKIDSPPSLEEFDYALEIGRPRLVFIKDVEEREPMVQDFINKMKDGRIEVSYRKFAHVIHLRDEVRNSIIETVTERFRRFKGEA